MLLDLLKVSTFLLFEFNDNHLKSNDLPISYRDFLFFARLSFLLRAKNVITDFSRSFLLCRLVPSMKMCSSDMTPSVCRNEILHVWFGDGDDIENEDAVQHPRI